MALQSLRAIDKRCIFAETFNSFSSIERNGGTVNGNPTLDRGICSFDGTGDFIDGYPVIMGVKAVVMRIKLNSTTEDIIDFDGGTHSIEANGGTLTATGLASPTFYVDGSATATIGTAWSHVVITTATGFNATAIKIGQETDSLDGEIDYIKFYNDTLTAEEAELLYENNLYIGVVSEGLVLYHNYIYGKSSFDYSRNGNNGSGVSQPPYYQQGAYFNGSNRIELANTIDFADDAEWSFCIVVANENWDFNTNNVVFGKNDFTDDNFIQLDNRGLLRIQSIPGDDASFSISPDFEDRKYYLVTFVCDGTNSNNVKAYVNNGLQDSNTLANSSLSFNLIGDGRGVGRELEGWLKAVLWYKNKALSLEEITQNYQYFKQLGYL